MFGSKSSKPVVNSSNGNIDTLLGSSCEISGDVHSKSSIKIDGHVYGNIQAQGAVILAEKGIIKGDVHAHEVIVYGQVDGNIFTESLHLQSSARIQGEISAKSLQIESGALYQGVVHMHHQEEDLTVKPAIESTTHTTQLIEDNSL